MIVQNLKPACIICKYWNESNLKAKDGWCSHIAIDGRHFSLKAAILGIQPDCPFIKNGLWCPEISLNNK